MNTRTRNRLAKFALAALAMSAASVSPASAVDSPTPLPVPEPVVVSQTGVDAAAESSVTKFTNDPTTTLAAVRAKSAVSIAKRQGTLAKLAEQLGSATKDCGANAAMKAELAATSTGLAQVGAAINGTTDLTTAKALYRSIFIDYRVYMVVAPKASKVLRCNAQLLRNETLAKEGASLTTSLTAAAAKGVNVASAQTALSTALAQLAGINPVSSLDGVMALVPDKGDKAIQTTNSTVLKASDTKLDANYASQKSVNAQFDAARRVLRVDIKVANQVAKKNEVASKLADKAAEKAAEKAAKAAEKESRKDSKK